VVGVGAVAVAVTISAADDWFGLWRHLSSWWQLSWGREGNFPTGVAMVDLVPYHVGCGFLLIRVHEACKTKASSSLDVGA